MSWKTTVAIETDHCDACGKTLEFGGEDDGGFLIPSKGDNLIVVCKACKRKRQPQPDKRRDW